MNDNRPPKHYRIQPRGLCRVEAADKLVADGRMPAPKRINSRNVWDVRQLDLAFEGLPSDNSDLADPFTAIRI